MGSSLNIASRVATQALPHRILLTAAARSEIGVLPRVSFVPLGKSQLKGLVEELELFEVRSEDGVGRDRDRIRDPVCGIEMAPAEIAAKLVVKGRDLAFCCEKCPREFLIYPERFVAKVEADRLKQLAESAKPQATTEPSRAPTTKASVE